MTTETTGRGQKVVILNQYYAPDVASTGHLLHELARDLASRGFDVGVVTTRPSYGPPETWQPVKLRETTNGVRIRRLLTTRLSKDSMIGRAINTVTFIVPLGVRMLISSRRDRVYLYTTNPPFLGVIGAIVSLFRRHNYVVLLHDAYPQVACWVGKIREGGLVDRVWHRINSFIYGRARETIVLCNAAKRLVCDTYHIDPDRVHVVPNWADENELTPKPKRDSEFAREHGLVEPFVIMYSGNLGLYYEFETILDAAEKLLDEPFRLVLIGSGGRKGWIQEQIRKRGLSNTLLLPYQPFETLSDSLTACDASLVTIAPGIEGISFPSKLYTSLAVGRPILALAEEHSDLRRVVDTHDVGFWFKHGDSDGLVACVRRWMADPEGVDRMGRHARELFEQDYTLPTAGARYAEVLQRAREDPTGPAGAPGPDAA